MKKGLNIKKLTATTTLLTAFFINAAVMSADTQELAADGGFAVGAKSTQQAAVQAGTQESQESQQPIDNKALTRVQFLEAIREQIRSSQKDYFDINRNVRDADEKLTDVREEILTFTEQLENLDTQMDITTEMVQNVAMQIGEKENQLVLLYEDMQQKNAALENQKQILMEYLQTIYEQESGVSDTMTNNDELSIAKLLLSDESVGQQLQEIKYFQILENTGHQIFDRLEELMTDLRNQEKQIETEKEKLGSLYSRLAEEQQNLIVQRQAKASLLEQTKGEETIYQQLLEESKKQEESVQAELEVLRDNLKFIQQKVDELGDDFDPEDYKSLFSKETTSVYEFIKSTKGDSDVELHWPVSPSRGISAYFHDPSYKSFFGVNHNAIDIRETQGTIIRAPADGVVYKVKDNGFGYSYLIIAHAGGLMTTYGHVSEFKVEAGEKVFAGQAVALTGGTPGSKGAGLMTTGAHLHFEVMKGGKYVDPLEYLPLTMLPFETLPQKYQSMITGEQAKVRREIPALEGTAASGDPITQMVEASGLPESSGTEALP